MRWTKKFLCAWLLGCVFATLGASAVCADVPVGGSVTISGEGSITVTTDPAAHNNSYGDGLVPFNGFLFASWTASPRFTVYASAHGESGDGVGLLGAFGRWDVDGAHHFIVDVGRIPVPFGTFGNRSTPFRNPLIDYPLMYGYPVSLRSSEPPYSPADLIYSAGGYSAGQTSPGLPLIATYPYNVGLSVRANMGQFSLSGAAISGSLSNSEDELNRIGQTVVGRLEWSPGPAWHLGASYDRGPWLQQDAQKWLRPRDSVNNYDQVVVGADVSFSRGPWQLTGEWARGGWQVPYLNRTVGVNSWYVEARYKVQPGLFVSGRYSEMKFDKIATGEPYLPSELTWDGNVGRLELGAGLYLSNNILLKGELESQHVDRGGASAHVNSASLSVNARF